MKALLKRCVENLNEDIILPLTICVYTHLSVSVYRSRYVQTTMKHFWNDAL